MNLTRVEIKSLQSGEAQNKSPSQRKDSRLLIPFFIPSAPFPPRPGVGGVRLIMALPFHEEPTRNTLQIPEHGQRRAHAPQALGRALVRSWLGALDVLRGPLGHAVYVLGPSLVLECQAHTKHRSLGL